MYTTFHYIQLLFHICHTSRCTPTESFTGIANPYYYIQMSRISVGKGVVIFLSIDAVVCCCCCRCCCCCCCNFFRRFSMNSLEYWVHPTPRVSCTILVLPGNDTPSPFHHGNGWGEVGRREGLTDDNFVDNSEKF